MQIDLEAMPFVDGHMHAPLAARPATADDYAWPWYEGNREYLEMADELVPFRWGMRQMGEWLGCEPEPGAIVAAIADALRRGMAGRVHREGATSAASCWIRATRRRTRSCRITEIAQQVPVAWLVRIEVEAQRLLAEASRSTTGWRASTPPARPGSTPAPPG